MYYAKLTPAPAGMTVTFPSDSAALPVIALVLDPGHTPNQHSVRAVAVREGQLVIAPSEATVAIAA